MGECQVGLVQTLYPSKIEAADLVGLLHFSYPDDVRADWHRNTIGLHVWIRAHVYRLIKHWPNGCESTISKSSLGNLE